MGENNPHFGTNDDFNISELSGIDGMYIKQLLHV